MGRAPSPHKRAESARARGLRVAGAQPSNVRAVAAELAEDAGAPRAAHRGNGLGPEAAQERGCVASTSHDRDAVGGDYTWVERRSGRVIGNGAPHRRHISTSPSKIPALTDTVARTFALYDRDDSGGIDVAELRDALAALGLAADSSQAQALLARYDTDRSGTLELDEFRSLIDQLRAFQDARGGADDIVARAFRRFDSDGSGSIDVEELHSAEVRRRRATRGRRGVEEGHVAGRRGAPEGQPQAAALAALVDGEGAWGDRIEKIK